MHLVGMLDSPYVRRCAIAGTLLGLDFQHSSISVFRHMDRFARINPLIKAPSLVTDDGVVLMESGLILQHFEDMAGRSLRPTDAKARVADLRATGLAMVAMEKAIAIEYERKRPEALRSADWTARVAAQLGQALAALEATARDWPGLPDPLAHGSIGAAVAVGFIRFVVPHTTDFALYPALAAHAERCEATAAFRHWPIDRQEP